MCFLTCHNFYTSSNKFHIKNLVDEPGSVRSGVLRVRTGNIISISTPCIVIVNRISKGQKKKIG